MSARTMLSFDFNARLENMIPGERAVYHVGAIGHDRLVGKDFLQVHAVAAAAWAAMEAGKVLLVQRRIFPSYDWEYIAIKLAPPYKPVEWTGCYDPDRTLSAPPKPKLTFRQQCDAARAVTQAATA